MKTDKEMAAKARKVVNKVFGSAEDVKHTLPSVKTALYEKAYNILHGGGK